MRSLLAFLVALLIAATAHAQPTTTTVPTTLQNTQCTTSQFLLGAGAGLTPTCQALTLGLFPSIAANTTLGATSAGVPAALAMPSCSAAGNALTWTSNSGWGCNTISTSSGAGTVSLLTYAGITTGSGQTLTVRQNNCTAINAAISFAQSNGYQLVAPGAIYEISCSGGIVIPAAGITGNGFQWRGNRQAAVFVQYYNTSPGAPILTIGDTTGTTLSYGIDFDGAVLQYGASETGLTSAVPLLLGAMTQSRIQGIQVGPCCTVTNPGYDGWQITNGGALSFIGNTIGDIVISGAQRHLLNASNALGPDNVFSNITLRDGVSGTIGALSGNCVTLGTTLTTEPKFTALDCKFLSANVVLDLEDAAGLSIDNLHFDSVTSTGANPALVNASASDLKIGSMQVKNWVVKSANLTGTPKVIVDAAATPSNIQVQSLNFLNTVASNVNTPFTVMAPGTVGNDNGVYSINQMSFVDTAGTTYAANVNIDSHQPTSSSAFLTPERVGRYVWGASGSVTDKEVIPVTATYSHYGQQTGATLEVPATITSFTITLQATQGASGSAPVQVGTVTCATRQTGTVSGTLTVQDDASNALTAPSTSGAKQCYIFNGTHYVNFTPVT